MIHRQGKTPSEKETDYICDFSRGRLNVRLYARIQPLLRGHKYSLFSLFEDCGLAGANALLYEIVIKFVKKIDYFFNFIGFLNPVFDVNNFLYLLYCFFGTLITAFLLIDTTLHFTLFTVT